MSQKQYRNIPEHTDRHIIKLIYTALTVIMVLFIVCITELVVLASVSSKVRNNDSTIVNPPTGEPVVTPVTPVTTDKKDNESTSVPVISVPSSARLAETEDYGQEYINKIIFVGDSTTYGLKAYAMLEEGRNTKQVWTPKTGTMSLNAMITQYKIVYPETGEEITIAEAAKRTKPEYMLITLGINYGVPYCGESEFKKYYRMLLDEVTAASPETKIILQSIYPVATNNELKDITNEKIDLANTWVEDLAEEYNLKYLHSNPVLKGDDGYLVMNYQNGDGLHLLDRGFDQVLNFIRTHGYPKS